jgi:hypothetical protein
VKYATNILCKVHGERKQIPVCAKCGAELQKEDGSE